MRYKNRRTASMTKRKANNSKSHVATINASMDSHSSFHDLQTRNFRQAPLIQIGGEDTYDNWVGIVVMFMYMAMSLSQSIATIFKAG